MAYRHDLLASQTEAVFGVIDGSNEACAELRDLICKDKRTKPLADEHPLINAARQVQEDLCVLQKQGNHHLLTAAVLCFPSSWDFREKLGRSIESIHAPVPEYSNVSGTVERMLSSIRVDQPLGRANFLIYTDPELHQPRPEGIAKPLDLNAPRYVRVERQTFRRLPKTLAVIFAIHSFVVPASTLSIKAHTALAKLKPELHRAAT